MDEEITGDDPTEAPDQYLDGDEWTEESGPTPGGNRHDTIDQNQTLQVDAPGLLARTDGDPQQDDPDQPSVGELIEQSQHGTLASNDDASGSFTDTPDKDFVGLRPVRRGK